MSKKINIYLFAFIIIIGIKYGVYGQNSIVLTQISDIETRKGISFATAEIMKRKIGNTANENGLLNFAIPTNSIFSDSVLISALGYENTILSLEVFKHSKQIDLTPKVYELPEFNIVSAITKNKTQEVIVGSKKRKGGNLGSYGQSLRQVGLFIKNNKNYVGFIKKVGFFIKKAGQPSKSFRIRIYDVDSLGYPIKDILLKPLIVKSDKGSAWFDVDLRNSAIKIPKYGFLVAIEWINSDSMSSQDDNVIIGMTEEFKEKLDRFKLLGCEWQTIPYNIPNTILNPMIRATLIIE